MPGATTPKRIGRGYPRDLEAGPFQPMIDSWDLHLRAERKSAKTIRTYLEAAQWFAGGYLIPTGLTDWDSVRAKHVQGWVVTLLGRYSDCYASNQFRAPQQPSDPLQCFGGQPPLPAGPPFHGFSLGLVLSRGKSLRQSLNRPDPVRTHIGPRRAKPLQRDSR